MTPLLPLPVREGSWKKTTMKCRRRITTCAPPSVGALLSLRSMEQRKLLDCHHHHPLLLPLWQDWSDRWRCALPVLRRSAQPYRSGHECHRTLPIPHEYHKTCWTKSFSFNIRHRLRRQRKDRRVPITITTAIIITITTDTTVPTCHRSLSHRRPRTEGGVPPSLRLRRIAAVAR